MKRKVLSLCLAFAMIVSMMTSMSLTSFAEGETEVSTVNEFENAVKDANCTTIKLTADLNFTDYARGSALNHKYDLSGKTLNLNEKTISVYNHAIRFVGKNFTITNGTFEALYNENHGNLKANYALTIFAYNKDGYAQEDYIENVTLSNLTTKGGINLRRIKGITLTNVNVEDSATGNEYYALCQSDVTNLVATGCTFAAPKGTVINGFAVCDDDGEGEVEATSTLSLKNCAVTAAAAGQKAISDVLVLNSVTNCTITEEGKIVAYSGYLDKETSDTYPQSTTVDQNYALEKVIGGHTDVTKVKVEWTVNDIKGTKAVGQVWNPDTLEWDEGTAESVTISDNGTATFTLTNLSSEEVNAKVTFAAVSGFTTPTVTFAETSGTKNDGEVTIGTVVGTDADRTVDLNKDHDEEIGVTVDPTDSDFISKALVGKYGTYTIELTTQN